MADGGLIDHPKLEQGDRKRMKSNGIDPNVDLNLKEIGEILEIGINLHRK